MTETNHKNEIWLILAVILIGVICRFLPHLPNFVPITAMALFAGRYFRTPWNFIVPISAMAISDIVIGFSDVTIYVYLSFFLIVIIGSFLKSHRGIKYIYLATISSSLIFFSITNLGVYLAGWYGYTIDGLYRCFLMAIPFLRFSLAGDLFYTSVFFGGYSLIYYYLSKSYLINHKEAR